MHELADLRAQGRVGGDGRRAGQAGQLGLDVDRGLPRRGDPAGVARLEHLADSSSRSRSAPAPDGGSCAGRSLPSRSDSPPRPIWS